MAWTRENTWFQLGTTMLDTYLGVAVTRENTWFPLVRNALLRPKCVPHPVIYRSGFQKQAFRLRRPHNLNSPALGDLVIYRKRNPPALRKSKPGVTKHDGPTNPERDIDM